jgi:hypothetical protein
MASPQPAPVELPALERIPLDRRARVLACLMRWRARMPNWEIGVLELLAATEADSVGMLRASLVRTADPRLRRLIERHIADESRHADLFAPGCSKWRVGEEPTRSVMSVGRSACCS